LFKEGEESSGVYLILEGRVKVSVNSAEGKTLVLGFFGPGTILGIAAAILGRTHATTAEAAKPTRAIFVGRTDFVKEVQEDLRAAVQVAQLVSENCFFVLGKIAAVELSHSASQRLARCLLGLVGQEGDSRTNGQAKLGLSQETVAQMVGLSRETATRLLSQFRRNGILDWKRSGLVIEDRDALERIGQVSEPASNSTRTNGAQPSGRKA
jgi:CRP-like cAMP-binding protein